MSDLERGSFVVPQKKKKGKEVRRGTNGRCKAQVSAFERLDIPLN